MTNLKTHYSFSTAQLRSVSAHGGRNPIMAARVLNQPSGAGCNFIDLAVVPVGSEIGTHTHNLDDQEIYIVIGGSAEMTVEGVRFAVNPGDVIVNPPGGTHSLENTGATPIQLVVIDVAYPVGGHGTS